MKPKIKTIFLFSNGNVAVCDEAGQQIPELQGSLIDDWCDKAVSLGYDPAGAVIEGELGNLKIVKNADGSWSRGAA